MNKRRRGGGGELQHEAQRKHAVRGPRALDYLVFRPNVQELAVVLGTLSVCKKVAERHALHVILVQVLALVALFALAAEPVLAHVCPFDALVSHGALEARLARALGEPAHAPTVRHHQHWAGNPTAQPDRRSQGAGRGRGVKCERAVGY